MQHIWAPWRIEYVARAQPDGCIFCHKAHERDDEAEQVLCRGRFNFVLLNAYPYNSGHLMVAPYAHVPELTDLDHETTAEMMRLAQACMRAMKRCLRPEGINLGMNIGKAAGAGIDEHIHLHIIPRWTGDTNFMTTVADTRTVPQALEASAQLLRPLICEEAVEEGL